MLFMHKASRFICSLLAISMLGLGVQSVSMAGVVTSSEIVTAQQVQLDREQIKTWLARDEAREKLIAAGVNVDDAMERIDSMTDQEVQQIATRMNEMPAGSGFVEAVVLAALVLIALEVTGVTDVLPNI